MILATGQSAQSQRQLHSKPPIKGPDPDGEAWDGVLVGSMFLERQVYTAGGAICV